MKRMGMGIGMMIVSELSLTELSAGAARRRSVVLGRSSGSRLAGRNMHGAAPGPRVKPIWRLEAGAGCCTNRFLDTDTVQ